MSPWPCRMHVVLLLSVAAVAGYVHDSVLPYHVPKDCTCAPWAANTSSSALWANMSVFRTAAASSCAMPANALTPDPALPAYAPADGWCLCDGARHGAWYTWCRPPAAHPSQINLLVVNATAVVVNFVTSDGGTRAGGCGCAVQAELRAPGGAARAFLGFSTRYRDSTSGRALSYHHVTLSGLAERARHEYRVRVMGCRNATSAGVWKRSTGIKWCSGGATIDVGDVFGQGVDGLCPLLPPGLSSEAKVALCKKVCGAPNATSCAGFTWYPSAAGNGECCFRLVTSDKPPDPSSDAVCYEKDGRWRACGGPDTQWSEWLDFTSLYSDGPTRLAIYADMGAFVTEGARAPGVRRLPSPARHHVGNLVDDLRRGLVDFAVHSGDHAYEFEAAGGARGDGYMDGYQAFLAHAPWAPGWGNHEYLEGDRGNRLAHITAGAIAERKADRMYYSVDVGLLHLLHLDLSPYWCRFPGCVGVDACGFPDRWVRNASASDPDARYDFAAYRAAALDFARRDLAAVDRARTPWVVVTAHYPFYETSDAAHPRNVARRRAERDAGARGAGRAAGPGEAPRPSKAQAVADFEPLLAEFSADFFFAGHNHNYEVTWPVYRGTVARRSYADPPAPIHILSGTAGPPEWDEFGPAAEWTRAPRLRLNSYSRLTLLNASVARFEQVANDDGAVVDRFTVTQTRNRSAPFPVFRPERTRTASVVGR